MQLYAQGMPPARVVLAAVEERTVNPTNRMVGVLRFDRVTKLSPEISGMITTMHLSDGLQVSRGQTLAELSGDFLGQDIAIAKAEIGEVNARIEQQSAELKRLSTLRKSNVASRSAYDETRFELKALRASKRALDLRVQRLELELGRTRIKAPFDAVVLERLQDVGEWATPESALGRLAATDYVLAVFPIAENFMPYQLLGESVQIEIPALKLSLRGENRGFVSTTEVRTRSAYLKIKVPYRKGMIENLSVEADIPTGPQRTLRMVPRAALIQAPGKPTVYTVKDDKAVAVKFEITNRQGDYVGTADDAVALGMQVVVDGNDRLRPGQDVNVVDKSQTQGEPAQSKTPAADAPAADAKSPAEQPAQGEQ